ncbi:MAG: imidazole glycerol phosphate synthase subunit HisH [Alphaproteobacteria bacterium]
MTVAIIDYGSGNLRSAAKAFEVAGDGRRVLVTADPVAVADADHIVLPGVGAFGDCRAGLFGITGMVDALTDAVIRRGAPFMGVCVGMQLMASIGREYGDHEGLGWIEGEVVPIDPGRPDLKIPHMGWNVLTPVVEHPVLDGLENGHYAYFVHSYHLLCKNSSDLLATTDYGGTLTAIVGRDNMIGTQFHPEKSQATGLRLIRNFLAWKP